MRGDRSTVRGAEARSCQAMHSLQMTARAFHRVLKLSRTIADLAACEEIQPHHLAEALQYRPRRW